jgi:trehalose/maltose hydrolase-like predicted phosphorylase
MGGFLQSLLFGYGGFRLRPDRIGFHGQLPPSTTSLSITGVDYLGGTIDFSFSNQTAVISLTHRARYPLQLKTADQNFTLSLGNPVTLETTKAAIVPVL